MILYILGAIILCIMLFFIYIRIKYRFWAIQPVFHFYDLYYWFINVGIINEALPTKNRYTNFKNITTYHFDDMNETLLKQVILLIQDNYLRNKENMFFPKQENIVPYFRGHNAATFLSVYRQPELLLDQKTGNTIEESSVIGVMTSRPLQVQIKVNNDKYTAFDVYYVDYLCVHEKWRKKNIAPQMIQTHEYNQSHQNKKICVSLFKREEELTGIVPLTVYKTYCFSTRRWSKPPELEAKLSLLSCDKQNCYYFYNFITEQTNKWQIRVLPAISNILELIESKNVFIKMIILNGDIVAAYIFKKTCTFIEKEKEIVSCIASIRSSILSPVDDVFVHGFKVALYSILNAYPQFHYLAIEDISDNNRIIQNLQIKTPPLIVSPTAYFFYNFAYSPFKSDKCLIIN